MGARTKVVNILTHIPLQPLNPSPTAISVGPIQPQLYADPTLTIQIPRTFASIQSEANSPVILCETPAPLRGKGFEIPLTEAERAYVSRQNTGYNLNSQGAGLD